MHEDYQLAYCPIAHITSLAFADDAFENTRLTPELLHKLRVPGRLHVLPLRFKKSMSNTPIFRGTVKTVCGVHTHPTRTMSYRVANEGLKRLGELAGYRYPIHYYCFRRWVANESNRKWQCTPHSLSHLSHLIANQSVFSQVISPNENETGFSATRVLLYLRNTITIIASTAIFKMPFSYDLHKSIFTEPPHK
jgi:hypothetical protein